MSEDWNEVHIKQRIEISIKGGTQAFSFGSIIVRKNDSEVYFRMPSSQHSAEAIRKGAKADVTIHTDKKVLKFYSEIGAVQPGNPPTVQILRPHEASVESDDKGGFYDMPVEVAMQYRMMRDPITPVSEFRKATTSTLSADECAFQATKAVPADSFIEITLQLPDNQEVNYVGKVTKAGQIPNSSPPTYSASVKTEVIRRGEQDKIIKFLFDRQRSLRKRGMY